MMEGHSLRKNAAGSKKPWSKQELLAGLQYFNQQYGHFPSAHEIDAFAYLPTSRSIQRSCGGLVALRRELLPDSVDNFTKGAYRSTRARATYANGRNYEAIFYKFLCEQFAEIAVHEQKLIRPGNVSSDFYVYLNENIGIVIDIFYAGSMLNLLNVVNIKLKRYIIVAQETYLIIVGNEVIRQVDVLRKMKSKRLPLPPHINVVTEAHFKDAIIPKLKKRSKYCR